MILLNDLLDLAKLESGKMHYKMNEHDMGLAVERVLQEFKAVADKKMLVLQYDAPDIPQMAYFDFDRIGQVLRNLLSNAIKFSEPGSRISIVTTEVTTELDGEQRAAVKLSVIDQGIGVPESERETIFDKFIQSSKTNTGAGGTGLGLPICKQIVADHRGARIWAEMNPDGGTIFCLILVKKHCFTRGRIPASSHAYGQ